MAAAIAKHAGARYVVVTDVIPYRYLSLSNDPELVEAAEGLYWSVEQLFCMRRGSFL
jgi:hypothetical protein